MKTKRTKGKGPPEARNNVLTRDLIKKICDLVLKGLPMDGCLDYVGVLSTNFYTWKARGELYLNDPENREPRHELAGELVRSLRKATAEYRLKYVERAHDLKTPPQHRFQDLLMLERRDRRNFGRFDPSTGQEESYDPDEAFL